MRTLLFTAFLSTLTSPAFASTPRCLPEIMTQAISAFEAANARGITARTLDGRMIALRPNLSVNSVQVRYLQKKSFAVSFEFYSAPVERLELTISDVDRDSCTTGQPEQFENPHFNAYE